MRRRWAVEEFVVQAFAGKVKHPDLFGGNGSCGIRNPGRDSEPFGRMLCRDTGDAATELNQLKSY